jgi:hypothetical protein
MLGRGKGRFVPGGESFLDIERDGLGCQPCWQPWGAGVAGLYHTFAVAPPSKLHYFVWERVGIGIHDN